MEIEQKRRGRPSKSQAEQQRRRKRKAAGGIKNLAVNPDLLDHENFSHRWINDEEYRMIQKLKSDDWTIVTQDGGEIKDDASDLGNAVSHVVGTNKQGGAMRAFLCRKPREWYEEDKIEKQTELDEQLNRLRIGQSAQGEAQADYIPNEGIKIAR